MKIKLISISIFYALCFLQISKGVPEDNTNLKIGNTASPGPPAVSEAIQSEILEATTASVVVSGTSIDNEPTQSTSSDSTIQAITVQSEVSTINSTFVPPITNGTLENVTSGVVNKFSDQIRSILKHFQTPGAVGFPGEVFLPDPMHVNDSESGLSVAVHGTFKNVTLYGLSNFTFEKVNTDLDKFQVYVAVNFKKLLILGNYTLSGFFMDETKGAFNVTLLDAVAEGNAYLSADDEGQLYVTKVVSDLTYGTSIMDFENITNTGSFTDALITSARDLVFRVIKQPVLHEIDNKMALEVNNRLKSIPKIPSTSILPVDRAVLEGRKFVKKMNYDPMVIRDIFKYDEGFISVRIDEFTLSGLSKFARVGNVTLSMDSGNIQIGIRLITGKLEGGIGWFYDFGKVGVTRQGISNFTIDHIQIQAHVNQSVDVRKKPVLDNLDIETGRVTVKMDGKGSFDYLIEMAVQLLPKLIRHMVVDALEIPIKVKVQEILNHINVEEIIEEYLPLIDRIFASGAFYNKGHHDT